MWPGKASSRVITFQEDSPNLPSSIEGLHVLQHVAVLLSIVVSTLILFRHRHLFPLVRHNLSNSPSVRKDMDRLTPATYISSGASRDDRTVTEIKSSAIIVVNGLRDASAMSLLRTAIEEALHGFTSEKDGNLKDALQSLLVSAQAIQLVQAQIEIKEEEKEGILWRRYTEYQEKWASDVISHAKTIEDRLGKEELSNVMQDVRMASHPNNLLSSAELCSAPPSIDPPPRDKTPSVILSIPISQFSNDASPIDPGQKATPCCLRFLDAVAFLDAHELRIMEFSQTRSQNFEEDLFSIPMPKYAAISYPWRDLQLPEGQSTSHIAVLGALHADPMSVDVIRTACVAARAYGCGLLWIDRLSILQDSREDKTWQIQRMFRIYKHCAVCLVFPGGLVRLARLDDSTTWIDRAWTLQEAAAPGTEKVKIVFQLSYKSYKSFIQERCDTEEYNEKYRRYITNKSETDSFEDKVLEDDRSAACDFSNLARKLWGMESVMRIFDPEIVQSHEKYPVRILRAAETRFLDRALDFGGTRLLIAAYTRSSSRPVDMVFSLMGLLGVHIDVSKFGKNDRTKATIATIQKLMKHPKATATWLYIAPAMTPSRELSTLPEMPETSESGRAYINTTRGRVLAFEAIGGRGANFWRSDGAPSGEMTDSGYFVFWGRAALLVTDVAPNSRVKGREYYNHETWAIVVGRLLNLNRNPITWKIQATNPALSPGVPEGVHELTLMLVEKHGHELYHRIGMEKEVDERKTVGWNWTYRRFQVGGPGRGKRRRFSTSDSGPVFLDDSVGNDEEDEIAMRIN